MSKILIVEDDNDINAMISLALGKEGYECVSAYSGTEGLLRLEHEDYDLVILDLMRKVHRSWPCHSQGDGGEDGWNYRGKAKWQEI